MKIKVGILGATGTVGQRFIQLLQGHPWFEIAFITGSERSVGKPFGEVCRWKLATPMPKELKNLVVEESRPGSDGALVFSGLGGDQTFEIEEAFARAGYAVISNASAHRMGVDIPLLIPEINPGHLELIKIQQENRGFSGYIVTNPNCFAIPLCLALHPLEKAFGIESVVVSAMGGISGAGYPGVPSLDILGNVIPYISDVEEEKFEIETQKILGRYINGSVQSHPMGMSTHTSRVPVVEGHLETVFVNFSKAPNIADIKTELRNYKSLPQELELPSAPKHPVIVTDEPDRPQPRLDVNLEDGMSAVVGRIRECPVFDAKFVVLGHNTIRGAAGASILNAELLYSQGYFQT
jgi:aspartate-semialdehyde dehydrogenase